MQRVFTAEASFFLLGRAFFEEQAAVADAFDFRAPNLVDRLCALHPVQLGLVLARLFEGRPTAELSQWMVEMETWFDLRLALESPAGQRVLARAASVQTK